MPDEDIWPGPALAEPRAVARSVAAYVPGEPPPVRHLAGYAACMALLARDHPINALRCKPSEVLHALDELAAATELDSDVQSAAAVFLGNAVAHSHPEAAWKRLGESTRVGVTGLGYFVPDAIVQAVVERRATETAELLLALQAWESGGVPPK